MNKEYLDEIKEELSFYDDRRDMLEALIEHGKKIEDFPEDLKVEANKVPGCVSHVYIAIEKDAKGKLHFKGSSESLIVRGFVAILLKALNNSTIPEIITEAKPVIEEFVESTGISESMVASRANAFGNIFRFMQKLAQEQA